MIPTNPEYQEIMKSNIRPKMTPYIVIGPKNMGGVVVFLKWDEKNISGLRYKRGIDPAGRSLPYMELTWTELYTGDFDEKNFPVKYKNVAKYMSVRFVSHQHQSFSGDSSIPVALPPLFLTGAPEIKGRTITWKARDILYFLQEKQFKAFNIPEDETGIPLYNPVAALLLNARGSFLKSPDMFNAISKSADNIIKLSGASKFKHGIIFEGATRDAIMNFASTQNRFATFLSDGTLTLQDSYFTPVNPAADYTSKIMSDYPDIVFGKNISTYLSKYRSVLIGDTYNASAKATSVSGINCFIWQFDKYGYVDDAINNIDYSLRPIYSGMPPAGTAHNVNYNIFDAEPVSNGSIGEAYVENNPVNPYSDGHNRFDFLSHYFNENRCDLKFSGLANPAVEPADKISVETNLFQNGQRIVKNALVISTDLVYNGAVREMVTAHEVI